MAIDLKKLASYLYERSVGKGISMRDICKELQCRDRKARDFVRDAIDQGLAKYEGTVSVIGINGQRSLVPTYSFKKSK